MAKLRFGSHARNAGSGPVPPGSINFACADCRHNPNSDTFAYNPLRWRKAGWALGRLLAPAELRKRFFVPRLAIVISAVGSVESLERTLVSVLENRPTDCEVFVALNQPYADPYDLKDEVRFVVPEGRSVCHRINQTLADTRAPFVHLLRSGCQVTEGWTDAPLARFGDRQLGSVAPMVLEVDHSERIFAAGVGYRPRGKRFLVGAGRIELTSEMQASTIGPGGFAAFYRKAALDLVGGLSTQLGPQQADVDLALCLATGGFTAAVEPQSRILASRDVDLPESPFRQALYDERLFLRNLPAVGRGKTLAAHAATVGLELLMSIPRPRLLSQLAGRTLAYAHLRGHARHREALKELGERAIRSRPANQHLRIDHSHEVSTRPETARARVHSR